MSDAVCVSCIDFESCFMRQLLSNLSWVKISESCLADILPLRVPAEDSEGVSFVKAGKSQKNGLLSMLLSVNFPCEYI